MVPFAGYPLPVQYPADLMAEHHHTRAPLQACLTCRTWSQLRLVGAGCRCFETLMPVDVIDLAVGKQRYGLLLTDEGTIIDDLMFVNREDLFVIVNGACKVAIRPHPAKASAPLPARCVPYARPGAAGAAGAWPVPRLARLRRAWKAGVHDRWRVQDLEGVRPVWHPQRLHRRRRL